RLSLWVRPELAEMCRRRIVPKLNVPTTVNQPLDDEPAVLVNGRSLHLRPFDYPQETEVMELKEGDDWLVWAQVRRPGLSAQDVLNRTDPWHALRDLPHGPSQSRLAETLADLVHWN